jgi:hypothetical protein
VKFWPFNSRQAPVSPAGEKPRDERGWNEDWQVGDLAECVADDLAIQLCYNPKKGDVLTVSQLTEGPNVSGLSLTSALCFEGRPQRYSWHCLHFRKHRGVAAQIQRAAVRGTRGRKPVREGADA